VRTSMLPTLPEWTAGLRVSLRDPVLRLLVVFMAVTSVGEGIMLTLMAPFVIRVLHGDAGSYGVILAVQAVGGIAGGLLIAAYGRRLSIRVLVGAGSVLFGALDLMLFLYPLIMHGLWPAGILIALVGLPGAGITAGYTTALQVRAGDDHRGRVFGAFATVSAAAILLGIVSGGTLGNVLGIIPVIAVQGGGYLLIGLYLTFALPGNPDRRPAVPRSGLVRVSRN
jgi:predicted MFS family arabinose efflux permease